MLAYEEEDLICFFVTTRWKEDVIVNVMFPCPIAPASWNAPNGPSYRAFYNGKQLAMPFVKPMPTPVSYVGTERI